MPEIISGINWNGCNSPTSLLKNFAFSNQLKYVKYKIHVYHWNNTNSEMSEGKR